MKEAVFFDSRSNISTVTRNIRVQQLLCPRERSAEFQPHLTQTQQPVVLACQPVHVPCSAAERCTGQECGLCPPLQRLCSIPVNCASSTAPCAMHQVCECPSSGRQPLARGGVRRHPCRDACWPLCFGGQSMANRGQSIPADLLKESRWLPAAQAGQRLHHCIRPGVLARLRTWRCGRHKVALSQYCR